MEYLDDPNFTFKVRYMYVKNNHNVPIKRVFQQIVLIDNNQKTLAKRFTRDFCMQNGATFNTNATKLLLFMTVGVTNTNQSLLAAFSFSTQASETFYNFFETCKMEKEKRYGGGEGDTLVIRDRKALFEGVLWRCEGVYVILVD